MIDELILHPTTRAHIESLLQQPTHAILLCGPNGIGKTAVARVILAELLGLSTEKLTSHAYYHAVVPEATGSISIEAIRGVQKFLQLKTTGHKPLRRAILVEQAHNLTAEAQNAFLKLLEEPPADTVIILTATSPRALLPTIVSRTQVLTVLAPEPGALEALLGTSPKDVATTRQAFFLSNGLPGLLHALLHDEQEHPLVSSVALAKDVLQKATFERLALVDSLVKQKEQARGLTEALQRIAQAGLQQATAKQDVARLAQWHRIRKAASAAHEALGRNANAKLTMTTLFLHL